MLCLKSNLNPKKKRTVKTIELEQELETEQEHEQG